VLRTPQTQFPCAKTVHGLPLFLQHPTLQSLYRVHCSPLVFLGFLSDDASLVSLDASGLLALWPPDPDSQRSGFGWLKPRARWQLPRMLKTCQLRCVWVCFVVCGCVDKHTMGRKSDGRTVVPPGCGVAALCPLLRWYLTSQTLLYYVTCLPAYCDACTHRGGTQQFFPAPGSTQLPAPATSNSSSSATNSNSSSSSWYVRYVPDEQDAADAVRLQGDPSGEFLLRSRTPWLVRHWWRCCTTGVPHLLCPAHCGDSCLEATLAVSALSTINRTGLLLMLPLLLPAPLAGALPASVCCPAAGRWRLHHPSSVPQAGRRG
jgi:hypothetical protein